MARVAIVSYDVQTIRGQSSQVGAFTTLWANMLRKAGEDVTIVMTRTDWEPMSVDTPWKVRYQAAGIGLIELQAPPALPERWPELPAMRVSELATPVLKHFDVVYLQDWGNAGFDLLRARRYALDQGPVCVTVLHGPSEVRVAADPLHRDVARELHLAYLERYCARHSDFVVSPADATVQELRALGWQLPEEVEVLGESPDADERWLKFHRKAVASADLRATRTLPERMPSVDVVTTYYQKGPYLPQFVDGFENQTVQDFCVLAVNDGSPDEQSNRIFAEQAERAMKFGWKFVRTENQWVDKARNTAAALGTGEFLLFLDADDVPARHAVERMREALVLSGDDAVVASSYMFVSGAMPYDIGTGGTTAPVYALCIPLGVDLAGGMIDPSSFGGSMFMVRRSAFEALGGYLEMRGIGYEDWELYVRLALAGYKVDAMADLLQFYRQVDGGVARLFGTDPAKRRLLAPYEAKLREVGMAGMGVATEALVLRSRTLETELRMLRARVQDGAVQAAAGYAPAEHSGVIGQIQQWYRSTVPMETRLNIHRILLTPFVGAYKPPSV